MIEKYLERASSYAADIDNLIWLILVIVGVWFLLAEAIFFGLILRFREKEGVRAQYISGEKKSEKIWITVPHYAVLVFDVIIIVSAIKVWMNVKQDMPPVDETVRIVSQQWAWSFVHPGPDKLLDTADDIKTVDELHVREGTTYKFELTSKDVLHSLSVPAFRLKQDAIPGRVITGWFKPTRTGAYDIQCAEICGIGHGLMPARIVIDSADAHARWLKATAPVVAAAPAPAQPENSDTKETP